MFNEYCNGSHYVKGECYTDEQKALIQCRVLNSKAQPEESYEVLAQRLK